MQGYGPTSPLGGNLGSTDPRLCLMIGLDGAGTGQSRHTPVHSSPRWLHRLFRLVISLSQGGADPARAIIRRTE